MAGVPRLRLWLCACAASPLAVQPVQASRRAAELAHPALQEAARICPPGAIPELEGWRNASGRLHRWSSRLSWLAGDIWPHGVPSELLSLAQHAAFEKDLAWQSQPGSCQWHLVLASFFYCAWYFFILGLKKQKDPADMLMLGLRTYSYYLEIKDPAEPLHEQEVQLALLFRSAHVSYHGIRDFNPCICMFQHKVALATAVWYFRRLFRANHTAPSGVGVVAAGRDAELKALKGNFCVFDLEYQQFATKWSTLLHPGTDGLGNADGCEIRRVLGALICGQSALLWGRPDIARNFFNVAMIQSLFAMDCFDWGLAFHGDSGHHRAASFLDIFAFLSRLDPSVAPDTSIASGGGIKTRKDLDLCARSGILCRSRARKDRELIQERVDVSSLLPPMCINGRGDVSVRVSGLSMEKGYLRGWSSAWSLLPVRMPLPPGAPLLGSSKAILLRVDAGMWTNLWHATFLLLLPALATAFRGAYDRGGISAVLQERGQVRIYLQFDKTTVERVFPRSPPWPAARLVPWLPLLSGEAAVLLPEAELDDDGRSRLRDAAARHGLQAASAADLWCHSAGLWGRSHREDDLDLLVLLAQSLPEWQVPIRPLLRRVWGPGPTSAPEGAEDPCLELGAAASTAPTPSSSSRCLRVLLVQRGKGAMKNARRVANLAEAAALASSRYSPEAVRLATVELEEFALHEQVALTSRTDVLVGAFGSAMWWSVFLPEDSCVLWLYPRLQRWRTLLHREHAHLNWEDNPFWSRTPYLDYKAVDQRWHVQLLGVLPSPGVEGHFELSSEVGDFDVSASRTPYLELDIYIDLARFAAALAGIVEKMRNSGRRRGATSTMRQDHLA